jgi:hypothetical protein
MLATAILTVAADAGAAQRQQVIRERFPAPPGKVVVVDVADVNLELRSADVRSIEVVTELRIAGVGDERADGWIAAHTPQFVDSEGELRITVAPGSQGFLGLGHLTARARMRMVVPGHVIPDLTTTSGELRVRGDFPAARPLRLRTATGEMELVGAAGSVEVRSPSGDARIELLRPTDSLFARTSSGNVILTGGARRAEADTASGSIRMSNLSGPVDVVTSTGKVILQWDRLDQGTRVRVRSASGKIQLTLPGEATASGTLTTTAGSIRSDLPGSVNERGDTVHLAGSGPILEVESASGAIVVGFAEEWELPAEGGGTGE